MQMQTAQQQIRKIQQKNKKRIIEKKNQPEIQKERESVCVHA